MTLARQVNLEESGNNGANDGCSNSHHAAREHDEQASETGEQQQGGAGHQQVYSTLLTTRAPYMRSDLYNHKGELDDSAYDPSILFSKLPHLILIRYIFPICKIVDFEMLIKVHFVTGRWL